MNQHTRSNGKRKLVEAGDEETNSDDMKLKILLERFDLEQLYPTLKNAGVYYKNLRYLNAEDIKEIIKPIGLRAEFREKLFAYFRAEARVEEEMIANNAKVLKWLEKSEVAEVPTTPSIPIGRTSILENFLVKLLKASTKGNNIFTYYSQNLNLSKVHRDDLIQIVVEEFIAKGTRLRPEDFTTIVNEIIKVFPNEKANRDFYFVPRKNKKNPRGKLYFKYFNLKTRSRKLNSSIENAARETERESEDSLNIVDIAAVKSEDGDEDI